MSEPRTRSVGARGRSGVAARRRALIIEDSDDVRLVIRGMLEQDVVDVVEARSGAEGLQHLASDDEIGLVFLDLHMPDMDGLQVLRSIRAQAAFEALPVVVLTGAAADAAIAAKEVGASGWLQKPVRLDAIIKVARNFLGPRESVRPPV